MTSKRTQTTTLEATLTEAIARTVQMESSAAKIEADARVEREQLERALKLARGTGDVQTEAAAAVATIAAPKSLAEKIEAVLRGPDAPLTFGALCKAVGSTAGRCSTCMRELRKANKVYNLGTEDHPRWIWIVGDETSTPDLNAHVARLVTLLPMTFSQLMAATGARRGRVSGAIVQLQRNPETRRRLQNLGDSRVFVWFLPTKR